MLAAIIAPGVRPVELDWVSAKQPWCLSSTEERIQNHDSNYKRKFIQKVTEVEEVICRRNGLRKQVTEAKEEPLKPRRKKAKNT